MDEEAESFSKDFLVKWLANQEDLHIMSENFHYNVYDTQKYNEVIKKIPRYIQESQILEFKKCGCPYQAPDMTNFLTHECFMCPMNNNSFKCNFCPTPLKTGQDLRIHYLNHSSEKIYICGSCDTLSSKRMLMTEHTRSAHENDVVVLEVLRSESNSVINFCIYLSDNCKSLWKFSNCIFCDLDLASQEFGLEEHLVEHHFFKLLFSCYACEDVTSSHGNYLLSHFKDSHTKTIKLNIILKSRFD